MPSHANFASCRAKQTVDHFQAGGLSRTASTKKHHGFTSLHGEVQLGEQRLALRQAKLNVDELDGDRRFCVHGNGPSTAATAYQSPRWQCDMATNTNAGTVREEPLRHKIFFSSLATRLAAAWTNVPTAATAAAARASTAAATTTRRGQIRRRGHHRRLRDAVCRSSVVLHLPSDCGRRDWCR